MILEAIASPGPDTEARVRELCQEVEARTTELGTETTAPGLLSATWRLLWTTEKETKVPGVEMWHAVMQGVHQCTAREGCVNLPHT